MSRNRRDFRTSIFSSSRGPTFQRSSYGDDNRNIHLKDDNERTSPPRMIFRDEDDYFEHDDESDDQKNFTKQQNSSVSETADDEEDPLDTFMRQNEKNLEKNSAFSNSNVEIPSTSSSITDLRHTEKYVESSRGVRVDIDEAEDLEESYYKFVAKNPTPQIKNAKEDLNDKIEYDEDGNPIRIRDKIIDPLPNIDHSQIEYASFKRCFYEEHEEIQQLQNDQVQELRSKLEIRVSGQDVPKPVCSFAHFKFDENLMRIIRKSEYTQPTSIQAQAVPAALQGRNVIGIAMTGSGKTAAYLWPLLMHIMGQPDLKPGDGPIGLILVPTRELALQVFSETKKFSKAYNIAVICAYGGGSKWEQSRDCEAGAEIIVATPGRIIDLVKIKATNLRRVTYLVLDEADRMFDMGFEAQVTSLCNHVRPDRQILMFSATFKKRIERLARNFISNPVKIVQRELGEANDDVTQKILIFSEQKNKWEWLTTHLVEFQSCGSVLIFVTRKLNAEELHRNLCQIGHECLLLHGDMDQAERNRVIMSFKRKEVPLMIATDVAARGLDIAHLRTVINYDVARDVDTHTHRIGRTGRAGTKGTAYSLMTEADKEFSGHLVKNLQASNQTVPEELVKMAMKSTWYRKSCSKNLPQFRKSSGEPAPSSCSSFPKKRSFDYDSGDGSSNKRFHRK